MSVACERVQFSIELWADDQPGYSPDVSTNTNGVRIRGEAHRLPETAYTEAVEDAIEALEPPMPPCVAYEIEPRHVFAPIIDDGVNERVDVDVETNQFS